MTTRRDFVATVGAAAVGAAWPAPGSAAAAIRFACHAMTWGDAYETGIAEISKAGFGGVQLRANVQARYGDRPAGLKALLARHTVELVCFSSGTVRLGTDREAETFALHEKHARFVQAAGGRFLQVTDERPKGRFATPDDRKRMGDLLTRLGRRTATRLGVLHVKDVRNRPRPVDAPATGGGYAFVELGRGRVDLKGAFTALADVGYKGWAIVELDAVPDPGGSATASMHTSKQYIEQVLKLPL